MLLEEAAEARQLASQSNHAISVRDLIRYASALEDEAARLGGPEIPHQPGARSDWRHVAEPWQGTREPNRGITQMWRAG